MKWFDEINYIFDKNASYENLDVSPNMTFCIFIDNGFTGRSTPTLDFGGVI